MTVLQARPDPPPGPEGAACAEPSWVDDLATGRGPSWLDAWLARHAVRVVGWRRRIHAHPELARAELKTTALVAEELIRAGQQLRLQPGSDQLLGDQCGGAEFGAGQLGVGVDPPPPSHDPDCVPGEPAIQPGGPPAGG